MIPVTVLLRVCKMGPFIFAVQLILTLCLLANAAYPQWTRKADEMSKRAESNNVLYKNKLYMFGGFGDNPVIEKTNEVYDIAANKWSRIASFPAGKAVTHMGTVLVDDNVWLIGGRAVDAHGPASSQVIIYNITTNTWHNGPGLADPATGNPFAIGAAGYALLGRTIHVFGGFGPTLCEDQSKLHLTIDVDKYLANPAGTTWENKLAPMPIPRNHISYVVLGGKIYAFGGQFKHDCGAVDQKYCHVYDPVTDSWKRLTDLPVVRSHAEAATFAVDGKMLFVGGQGVNNVTQNTTYEFNPQANNGLGAWANLPAYKLPGSFLGLSAKLAGKNFIITNGALDKYSNERKETYIASITRSTKRTLGFSAACIAQDVDPGNTATVRNLLYCIEDTSPYTLTSDAGWLTITKAGSGIVNLNGEDIEVTITTAGLAAGRYTGTIKATGTSTASFCVNLNVTSSSGYALTVTQAGNGSVSKTPDENVYPADSTVVLTALPAQGWTFEGWTGDTAAATNPLSIVMTGNKALKATFVQDQPPVAMITNVKAATNKSYRLGELSTGITYYTDRDYNLNAVPASLEGQPFIKTPNDDKVNTSPAPLSFNLEQDATVYIAYDPRATALPAWLRSWKKLTDKLGVNDPKITAFDLYSKDHTAGKVTLGGNMASPAAGAQCGYIVIAKAKGQSIAANKKAAIKNSARLIASAVPGEVSGKTITSAMGIAKPVLYPNPVADKFRVVFPDTYKGLSSMQIMDTYGKTRVVPRSQISAAGPVIEVHLAPLLLKAGLYSVIMVSKEGKTDAMRIIIQ